MTDWNLGFSSAIRGEVDYERVVADAYAKLSDLDLPFEHQRFFVELCKSKSAELRLTGTCGGTSQAELIGRIINLAMGKFLSGTDIDEFDSYIGDIDSYVALCKEEAKAVN